MATESKFRQFFRKNMPICIAVCVAVFIGIVVGLIFLLDKGV